MSHGDSLDAVVFQNLGTINWNIIPLYYLRKRFNQRFHKLSISATKDV